MDQDGNCGVLYERMARALVLCSSAGGTADMQQAAAQRRQTETRRLNKHITLWLFNIAMENGPFIDGLRIKNGDFHSYVSLPEGTILKSNISAIFLLLFVDLEFV